MGYMKAKVGSVIHPIWADTIFEVKDNTTDKVEIVYAAQGASTADSLVFTATAATQAALKAEMREAVIKYQANQEGPAILMNPTVAVSAIN